jgi:hypothetical protein
MWSKSMCWCMRAPCWWAVVGGAQKVGERTANARHTQVLTSGLIPGHDGARFWLTLPGLLHDHCSAVHPLGVGSPFLRTLGLEGYGCEWAWPEVDLAHPLDGGRAGVLVRSVAATARGLGADGPAWERLFAPPAEDFDALT